MIQLRNILVPTDFSAPAERALKFAKTLAAEFGSRLHLLHVVVTPPIAWAAESDVLPWPMLLADLEAQAETRLEHLVPAGDPVAGHVIACVVIGPPLQTILDYVAAQHIDLVVMGTHGRGGLARFLLGSVAERMVHSAQVPVLTIDGTSAPKSDAAMQGVKTRSPLSVTVL
jgi:nucleotide-binding universal stress UspA family protein